MSSVSATAYPAPGARIGRFRILDQLGQGGMGVVYRALEENLGREVALKIVAPQFAHDPEFRERFTREARAQASLESAHVVAVYAHGEEDGYLYIASQLIADGDLGQLIRTAGVPPLVDAVDVIEQVASGLADAHEAGLVHRDIKPGNVLVRIRGNAVRAYLADFGIARRMDAQSTRFAASAVGTPSYMAPELHTGAQASPATDVYSLGCLLWVALTGHPPYTGASEYQITSGHVNDPIPQLDGGSAMVHAVNRILGLAMAKDPADRYPTAQAMRADLQAALRLPHTAGTAVPQSSGTAIRARPSGPPTSERGAGGPPAYLTPTVSRPSEPPRKRPSRTTWIAAAAVAGVVAATGGVVAALTTGDGGSGQQPQDPASSFLQLSPEEMLRMSDMEMKVLDSVRVKGQLVDGKQKISVDMTMTADGDCHGRMGYIGGGEAEILRVDGRVLIKPDEAFIASLDSESDPQQFIDFLDGRWFEFTDDPNSFSSVCDLDEFLERDGRGNATVTDEGVNEVGGEEVVKVHLQEGSNQETYFIEVDEPHYLLRVDESGDASFTYSEFDEDVDLKVPPSSQILKDTDVSG